MDPDADQAPRTSRRANRRAIGVCFALWALALGLRWSGLGYMLPHAPEPDAYLVRQAELMRSGEPVPDEGRDAVIWRKYPHLLSGLLALLPLESEPLPPLSAENLTEHERAASRPYLLGRALCALVASLAVPLTWLLARRFMTPIQALLPAALVATSLLHLQFSQQARPHGPLATFTLATTLLAVELVRRGGGTKLWALAGICAGLSVACLHNGIAALLPLAAAWWYCERKRGIVGLAQLLWPTLAVALALWLAYPFLWSDARFSTVGLGQTLGDEELAGHRVQLDGFRGRGFEVLLAAFTRYDPLFLAFGLIGVLVLGRWMLARRLPDPREALVAAAFALPYAVVIGLYDRSFVRFSLPLVPFTALLASIGLFALARALPGKSRPWALTLTVVLLVTKLALAWHRIQLLSRPDTYELMAQAVATRIDGAEDCLIIGPRGFLPALLCEQSATGPVLWDGLYTIPWREYLKRTQDPEHCDGLKALPMPSRGELSAEVRRTKGGELTGRSLQVLRSRLREQAGDASAVWVIECTAAQEDRVSTLGQTLDGYARLVADINPFPDPDLRASQGYQDESALIRLLRADHMGPRLRLWQLP